jgi:hypothetical protein
MYACRRGGGPAAQAVEQAASGYSDAEAARQSEARALAAAELLRRENRSTWTMLDERQQAIQRLEVGQCDGAMLIWHREVCEARWGVTRVDQSCSVAERDGDTQTPMQESQSQQADENARLRSTLEEWSLANRKLELEVAKWKKAAAEVKTAAEVPETTEEQQ